MLKIMKAVPQLHSACAGGNYNLVRTLIQKYKVPIDARDDQNDTPIQVGACSGKEEVVLGLLSDFHIDVNTKGFKGRSLLHSACKGGNVNLVRTLVRDLKASLNSRNGKNNTPLHVAALHGNEKLVLTLLNEFHCDVNTKGFAGRSLIFSACEGGSIKLVQTLIQNYKADVHVRDAQNDTPLHFAAYCGKEELVLSLVEKFHCDINAKGFKGRSLLHKACMGGNVNLVRTLKQTYNLAVNARDDENSEPIHVAAFDGKENVILALVNEFQCDINTKGIFGRSLLHYACQGGDVTLIKSLIRVHGFDIFAQDKDGNTALHIATSMNRQGVALLLLDQLSSDEYIKARFFSETPSVCSDIYSSFGERAFSQHRECLKALFPSAALIITNANHHTPRYVAKGEVKSVLDKRMKDLLKTKLCSDCTDLFVYGKNKFSGSKRATRVFVLGNSGVGKSSLVEALQRDSFFQSFLIVDQSSIPPHTAGIVPHFYQSKGKKRVLFYDFAGDPEYYSSHSAILENLASSRGDNLFIVVVDLREEMEQIRKNLYYWLSFIHHHQFEKGLLSLAVVGSHADQVKNCLKGRKVIKKICGLVQHRCAREVLYVPLNCCNPRSAEMHDLRWMIAYFEVTSHPSSLSVPAVLLLGMLERDFNDTIACSVKQIQSHIEENMIPIPTKMNLLHSHLEEIHEAGLLLMIKSKDMNKSHIIMDSTKLTNGVHRLLFSRKLQQRMRKDDFFHIGIVAEDYFSSSGYISKDCLIQLQYCQEIQISNDDISSVLRCPELPDKSFLFFPALVSREKNAVSWTTPHDLTYGIGWLAWCCNLWHFFSPRFLHVLILKLVCRFALSTPLSDHESGSLDPSPYFQQFCGVWKTGVCWLTKERVECTVELVSNKELVVRVRGEEDKVESCNDVFSQIISYVMNAKAEFCRSIKPDFYLLDSTSEADYLSDDNLFSMKDVESALISEEKGDVVSVNRRKRLRWNKIASLRHFTHWRKLFPIDYKSVLPYLVDITSDLQLCSLGLQLNMFNVALMLEADFPTDIRRRKRELVREWMSSSCDPPCWWTLKKALEHLDVRCATKAGEIREKYGKFMFQAS